MYLLNILIMLTLLCLPSTGRTDNYDAILGFQNLSLSTLVAADLIIEHSPHVFIFRDARPPDDVEIATSAQLANMFRKPILLLSNIQFRGEYVGGFDAVIYSNDGEPTHNVSLKSTSSTQARMKDWMRSQAAKARSSLSNATNRLAQLGSQSSRRDEMLTRLLGINSLMRRPSILVLDLSRLSRSVVQCDQQKAIMEGTCQGDLVRGLKPLFDESPFDIELALFSNSQFYFSRTAAGQLTRDVDLLSAPGHRELQRRYSCHEWFATAQRHH